MFASAFPDAEFSAFFKAGVRNFNGADHRCSRFLSREGINKRIYVRVRRLGVDLYAALLVQHPSANGVSMGQPIDEWAKADALHHTAHQNATRGHRSPFVFTMQPRPCQPT